MVRHIVLWNGVPLQTAPSNGSPITLNRSADRWEFKAPRLRPCR
jgi:hypothetical protein